MAVTLLQYWQQQRAIYQAEQTAAQNDLAGAQKSLGTISAQLATDLKALDKAGSDIAAARARLGVTTIPAEANALIAQITSLIIAQRGLQGAVLDDQESLAAAQAAVDSAGRALARATARVAGVQSTIATVQTDDVKRLNYKSAIATAPLSTLKADATAFLASATVTHATSRIGKNFPAQIVTIAAKRHDTRVNRLKSLQTDLQKAQDVLGTQSANDGGLDGTTAQKRIAFVRAQDALADHVSTAVDRFEKAKAVMTMLEAIELDTTGSVPDVLTQAEKSQLTSGAALGAAAEATAETLDGDLNAVFTAEDALDAQILTSIAANVDTVSTDPMIASKRAAIDTAKTAFKTALATFAAANKKDLDQWEAIVPDGAWKVLLDFEEASAALNDLASIDPATLATAMDNAEDGYATALGAAASAQRRLDHIGDAIALSQQRLDFERAAIAARLPSAIRGDSY